MTAVTCEAGNGRAEVEEGEEEWSDSCSSDLMGEQCVNSSSLSEDEVVVLSESKSRVLLWRGGESRNKAAGGVLE